MSEPVNRIEKSNPISRSEPNKINLGSLQNPRQVTPPQVKKLAQEFESVFMSELLRHTKPEPNASGRFATSFAERNFTMFLDQAIGEASAKQGGSGLGQHIEQNLSRRIGTDRSPNSTVPPSKKP